MNLYNITSDIKHLMGHLESFTEQQDDEMEKAIKEHIGLLNDDLETKVENIVKMIRERYAMFDVRMAEADRLKDLAKLDEKAALRLQEWLHLCLKNLGQQRVETSIANVRVSKVGGRPRMEYDLKKIPEQFYVTQTERVLDKDMIRRSIDEGVDVPGVVVKERGTYLSIK
jgi:hypothetical protein